MKMMFQTLNDLLEHIKQVELDTITLSQEAQLKISNFIEKNKLELDDEAAEALQYQDIVSQQLSATIEAIETVQTTLKVYAHNFNEDEKVADSSIAILRKKLDGVLDTAKAKKEAFSGHTKSNNDEHEIEFF
jgi:uncharacterized damage-inducible protein DinB